jgi:hypothetical protein|tara:strand:- start:290 stop:1513 length:1224 start_codon:yes stop_codon:yes gene_type:complete
MNIIFIADSATMLLELDRLLINNINVIWVVHYDSLYKELISYGVDRDRIKLIDLRFPFINRPLLIKKIMNRIFHYFFKERTIEYYFQDIARKLNKKYNPIFYLTDTSKLLSRIHTATPKATILHSVPYKHHYLNSHNLNYDIFFLPGNYHKKRLRQYYPEVNFSKNQLEIIGNLKLSPFINKKTLDNDSRYKLLESYGLNPNWPLVLYAPTHDAFEGDSFFPDEFKGQYEKLEEYAEFLEKNKFNLILKFHYVMVNNFESKEVKKILSKKNTSLFKTIKNHNSLDGGGNDLLIASDIVVGDTSGILTTATYLDKKLIFIEPGKLFDWNKADIEKELRPGYVCTTFDNLLDATIAYMTKDEFIQKRAEFRDKVFYKKEVSAYPQLRDSILKYIARTTMPYDTTNDSGC